MRRATVLLALLATAGCAVLGWGWRARVERHHPLVGTIWDVAGHRRVDTRALVAALTGRTFVLLGEKHDNPDHHRLQARMIGALVRAGRRPAVAFEMLSRDLEPALHALTAKGAPDANDVRRAVGWDTRGWPPWKLYRPVFETALDADLSLVAADLDPAWQKALSRGGPARLSSVRRAYLGFDEPFSDSARAALENEISEAHCGLVRGPAIERMVDIQRARDAALARALIEVADARPAGGAVLIAGAGHARHDRGVPLYLGRWAPGSAVASVAILEVIGGALDPVSDAAGRGWRAYPYDYVWFTPRVDAEDPCERYRRRLEQIDSGSGRNLAPEEPQPSAPRVTAPRPADPARLP